MSVGLYLAIATIVAIAGRVLFLVLRAQDEEEAGADWALALFLALASVGWPVVLPLIGAMLCGMGMWWAISHLIPMWGWICCPLDLVVKKIMKSRGITIR